MTCVEVMYHQPFASPFSSPVYPSGRGTGGASSTAAVRGMCSTNGFATGQSLSRMHNEPLNLGHTATTSLPSLPPSAHSSSLSSSSSSAISSTPLSAPSSYYPPPSFLLTPSSSGPPSGNTLISPSPPLLTSPQLQQQQQPATSPETPSSSPQRHHSSSFLSSSSSSPPSSSQQHHHPHHHLQHQQQHSTTSHQHRHFPKGERSSCGHEVDNREPKSAQYLTANCVLFTYDNGSVGEMVDDHFTKALSGSHGETNADNKHSGSKAPVPMSSREFPPSFWNSSYYQQLQQHQQQLQQQQHQNVFGHHRNFHHQPPHHLHHGSSSTSSASDMGLSSSAHYFSPALHGFSNLQSEAWGYGLSSPSTGMAYTHRHMPYDLSSYSSSSRFGQNYNPFLVQPSVVRANPFSGMTGHMPGHSDVTKEHSRTSRFPDHRLGADYTTHPSFTAIDSLQEATKDLYWF